VLIGAGSVFYWDHTERLGAGDLRLYLIVQFFPLLILPILLLCYSSRYTHGGKCSPPALLSPRQGAGTARQASLHRRWLYQRPHAQHLVAALGAGFVLLMLRQRLPSTPSTSSATVIAPAAL